MMSAHNRVAVITGAGGRIGKTVTLLLPRGELHLTPLVGVVRWGIRMETETAGKRRKEA